MAFGYIPDEDHQVEWVVADVLARSQRPGYPADRPPMHKIQEWANTVTSMGIQSVLCVLDKAQVRHYDDLKLDGGGLFGYYRTLGLVVEHIPAEDYKTPPLSNQELAVVWEAFQRLEKPVLVHCSAGRDRTGAAVQHILKQLGRA